MKDKCFYHNILDITGPEHIIEEIYKKLDDCDGRSREFLVDARQYIPMSDAVKASDYELFQKYWRIANWAFLDAYAYVDRHQVNKDSTAKLDLHIVSEDGHIRKLVAAIAEAHPLAYIEFAATVARPWHTKFVGAQEVFVRGEGQQAVRLIKESIVDPHPLYVVWKLYKVDDLRKESLNEVLGQADEDLSKAAAEDIRATHARLFGVKAAAGGPSAAPASDCNPALPTNE